MTDAIRSALGILDKLVAICERDQERNDRLTLAILSACKGAYRIGDVVSPTPFGAAEQFAAQVLLAAWKTFAPRDAAQYLLYRQGLGDERPLFNAGAANLKSVMAALRKFQASLPAVGDVDAEMRQAWARARARKKEIERYGNCAGAAMDKAAQLVVMASEVDRHGCRPAKPAMTQTPTRPKRSTAGGDAREKLIAALVAYHGYTGRHGDRLNQAPIGVRALARAADVAPSTASEFLRSIQNYKTVCRNNDLLRQRLRRINADEPLPFSELHEHANGRG